MRAAVLHKLGSAPRYEEFEDPVARDGEVLIKVLAASLKPIDKAMAGGAHYASFRELPVVCGVDGVGMLETGTRVLFGGSRALRRDGRKERCAARILPPNPRWAR